MYRVAFHGKEPRCFIVRISSKMPRRLVFEVEVLVVCDSMPVGLSCFVAMDVI
jgi:hypothetical protein